MQVSALNTLIAAQQARQQTRPVADAKPVAATEKSQSGADFAPMAFKAAAAGATATQAAAPAANGYSPTAPLGSQLDIRV